MVRHSPLGRVSLHLLLSYECISHSPGPDADKAKPAGSHDPKALALSPTQETWIWNGGRGIVHKPICAEGLGPGLALPYIQSRIYRRLKGKMTETSKGGRNGSKTAAKRLRCTRTSTAVGKEEFLQGVIR